MNSSWKSSVEGLCSDSWGLNPRRTQQVIEELGFLMAADQLSEVSIAGVLATVGLGDPAAGPAARSIRAAIGDTGRSGDGDRRVATSTSPRRGPEMWHPRP